MTKMFGRMLKIVCLILIAAAIIFWILVSVMSLSTILEVLVFTQYRQSWDLNNLPSAFVILFIDLLVFLLLIIRYIKRKRKFSTMFKKKVGGNNDR